MHIGYLRTPEYYNERLSSNKTQANGALTQDQKRFAISEVAANFHELIVVIMVRQRM